MCYNGLLSRATVLLLARPLMPRRPAVLLTPPYAPHSSLACPELQRVQSPYTSFVYQNEAHPLSPQPLPHSYTKTPGCHPELNSHFGTCTRTTRLLPSKRELPASNSSNPSKKRARNAPACPHKHWLIKRGHAAASVTCALLHRQVFLSLLGFRFCAVQAGVLSQIVQPLHSSRLAEASREPQETPYCLKKIDGDVPNGRSCGWTRENCFPHLHGRAPERSAQNRSRFSVVDRMFSPSRTRSK